MLTSPLQDALNEQIKNEIFSAHVYLSMSAWLDSKGLPGMAGWMRAQYQEELTHGLKIFDFIADRGGRAVVPQIDLPPAEWSSVLDAFESAYKNELLVSKMINDLYELAISEADRPTQVMLQWFIAEQVEEEKSVSLIVDQLKLGGGDGGTLLLLDDRLGARAAAAAPAA